MDTKDNTILLADDDPNDVLLTERALKRIGPGGPVHVVQDGEEAVAYLKGDGAFADRNRFPLPTLLLLDLKMPRRSGFEVLEWLRQQPGLRRLPVVVFTSSNQDSDVTRAYELGANSYLVKPAGFDNLVNMMKCLRSYWLELSEKPEIRAPENPA
jgi:CheY-like chemotaxis protein